MKCADCDCETMRITYSRGRRLCPDCGVITIVASALAHNISISKRKYSISMTHAEVMRIRTNRKQPDGTWAPHWKFKDA